MEEGINKIVGLAMGLLVAGVVVPVAISQIAEANTTSWNPAVTTVFSVLLPILGIIALALYFMPRGK